MNYLSDPSNYIEIKNIGGQFEISWDFKGAPGALARLTECERLDGYIDGFIDGFLVALEIPNEKIDRSLSSKCKITGLEKHVALKLKKLLVGLFQPLIIHEHKAQNTQTAKHLTRESCCAA